MKNLVKFYEIVLKILNGNEILTSIKGHKSVINLQKLTRKNPNPDLVTYNAYPNFCQIPSIRSINIERKRNSENFEVNQGP